MTLELTVLGSAGVHPAAGRVCSGYLLRSPTTEVMLDCGNGSTSRFHARSSLNDLDAIVVSHRHPDHCVDLIGTYYALRFDPDSPRNLDVYAPAGTGPFLAQLLSDDGASHFLEHLRFHDVEPGDHVRVGDVDLRFFDSPHAVPTVAVRAEHDGTVLAYSGDSGGGEDVVAAAGDADLFLCEATWLGDPDDYPPGLHLTARGAGQLARDAAARRLVLTHLYATNDPEESRRQAEAVYYGPVEVADDGATWSL